MRAAGGSGQAGLAGGQLPHSSAPTGAPTVGVTSSCDVWYYVLYVILRVRIELVPRTHCRDMSPPYQLSDRGSLSGAGLCVARTYSIQFNTQQMDPKGLSASHRWSVFFVGCAGVRCRCGRAVCVLGAARCTVSGHTPPSSASPAVRGVHLHVSRDRRRRRRSVDRSVAPVEKAPHDRLMRR
jgi:hypothetical protein